MCCRAYCSSSETYCTGVSADCVAHDIHTWRVQVSDVSPECALAHDLQKLGEVQFVVL